MPFHLPIRVPCINASDHVVDTAELSSCFALGAYRLLAQLLGAKRDAVRAEGTLALGALQESIPFLDTVRLSGTQRGDGLCTAAYFV